MRRLGLALAAFAVLAGAQAETERPKFRWPVIGHISKSPDGRGVEIGAPEGEAVHAAADGEVIYAGDEIASYGQMIVIRHAGDFVTAYAHLSALAVAKGAKVKRGDTIGKTGHSGDAKAAGLHFELRQNGAPIDPVGNLSPR